MPDGEYVCKRADVRGATGREVSEDAPAEVARLRAEDGRLNLLPDALARRLTCNVTPHYPCLFLGWDRDSGRPRYEAPSSSEDAPRVLRGSLHAFV